MYSQENGHTSLKEKDECKFFFKKIFFLRSMANSTSPGNLNLTSRTLQCNFKEQVWNIGKDHLRKIYPRATVTMDTWPAQALAPVLLQAPNYASWGGRQRQELQNNDFIFYYFAERITNTPNVSLQGTWLSILSTLFLNFPSILLENSRISMLS